MRKAFVLTGDRHNGKSTYLDMINNLLGPDNVSNLDIDMLGDRFSTASLSGVLANIGDDISDDYIKGTTAAQFKKTVSGSKIKGERKGKDEFFFAPYCKMLFSANSIPRIKDKTGAVTDRMIIIPFQAHFNRNDPDFDPYIKYKLMDAGVMEALIILALDALKGVLARKGFTVSAKANAEMDEYEASNNPVKAWLDETDIATVANNPVADAYAGYNRFCQSNGFQAMSSREFGRQLCRYAGLESKVAKVGTKSVRIYVRK